MRNLTDIAVIQQIMAKHGFSFSKSLGQNFIIDADVCPAIAEQSGIDGESGVLEIGPGIGVLTQELAKRAKKVVALELDGRLLPILEDTLAGFDNVTVIHADAMKIDLEKLIAEHFAACKSLHVCANLPYYITSPILMRLLESRLPFQTITVMVQKEAGERLCAKVGSREAGAVSVAVNYYAKAQELFSVPREAFLPSPKVDSEVIQLTVRESPEYKPTQEAFFFKTVKAAFSQRRKTAQNGLAAGLGLSKSAVGEAMKNAGLEATVRAEKLTMEQLYILSEELYKLREQT